MITLRPSKMPGFIACPSYLLVQDFEMESTNEAAKIGVCIHKIFEDLVSRFIQPDRETIRRYASQFGVDFDGYNGVDRKTRLLWEKFEQNAMVYFQSPEREFHAGYTLSNKFRLEGTMDLVQINQDMCCVLDLKTGQDLSMDAMIQIKTYCLLIYRTKSYLMIKEFYGFIFNPVMDYYRVDRFTIEDLESFEREIIAKAGKIGTEFTPGPQCSYCPNLVKCPAHIQAIKTLLPMTTDNEVVIPELSPQSVAKIRPLVKFMAKLVDAYKASEKAYLEQNDGLLKLPDGTELYFENETRKTYNFGKVMDAFEEFKGHTIDRESLLKKAKIKQEDIDETVKSFAEKGKKGEDLKAFKTFLSQKPGTYTEKPVQKTKQRVQLDG